MRLSGINVKVSVLTNFLVTVGWGIKEALEVSYLRALHLQKNRKCHVFTLAVMSPNSSNFIRKLPPKVGQIFYFNQQSFENNIKHLLY